MDLLSTKHVFETDFFKVWAWLNKLNLKVQDEPEFFTDWYKFYLEHKPDYDRQEKIQDVISINKVKTKFYHFRRDMTEEMIESFVNEKIKNISIRIAFEDHIRFNAKIISKLVKKNVSQKGRFDFNNFIRRSLSFTDFVLRNKEIVLDKFEDADKYKRKDFIFESDPNLNIAIKLKRYGFPHQSFYNFLNENNKAIPRKKFLIHLSYFFQFDLYMTEILLNQYGYTIENSQHTLDQIIKYCLLMGVSFDSLIIIANHYGYNF